GFTMAVFSHFGISLPHNAAAQSGCGTQVSLSDIQPGDLLFYDNGGGIGHVTIYIGNGQVCHAS
ncbi:MAG TPA: hydrolase, partial [Lachnospiraceae bacterium]|nr:hydrolase [Lachnospiraceae bacterium]